MSTDSVAAVREFNRFYTRVSGVLDAGLAGSPFSLTEARVLFELSGGGPVEVGGLRTRLGLDAGYLSRILARLGAASLVVRSPSADDARRQIVTLTAAGIEAFAALDAAQSGTVRDLLTPLADGERERLLRAMADVRAVLDGGAARPAVVLRAPEPGDLGWIVSRHGALYAREYGWDATFEALVARLVADLPGTEGAATWIAEVGGVRAGSVSCVPDDAPGTARLRMLLVEPAARGAGLGGRLVEQCLRHARQRGCTRLTLWTNDVLTGARRIYERAGFTLDRSAPHRSFGHDLVGEHWSRTV